MAAPAFVGPSLPKGTSARDVPVFHRGYRSWHRRARGAAVVHADALVAWLLHRMHRVAHAPSCPYRVTTDGRGG